MNNIESTKEYIGTYQYSKSDKFMQGKDRLKLGKEVSDTLQTTQKEGIVLNRFYNQAFKTIADKKVKDGDVIDAYNQKVLTNGTSPTITTRPEGFKTAILPIQGLRIRKLTPRECFRLMGVKDDDFDKISKNQSDSSLYHLAGDSIVVNVLMAIFKEMM